MISVVIPSFNSEHTIVDTLTALQNQSYDGEYEVVLVDSSTDRTPDIVRKQFPDVHLIYREQKTDPFTARNIGVEVARGSVIAFLDADCTVVPDWLKCIAEVHQSGYKIMGGVVHNGNDPDDAIALAGYMAEFREFLPRQEGHEVPHLPTCNIAYDREIFDKYGLFDERFHPLRSSPGIQQGDLIYNYRVHQNGERIYLDPRIAVYHHHRSRWGKFFYHQRRLGRCTSGTLKILDLQGATIARNPALAVLAIPLLPIVKFFRTMGVFLDYDANLVWKRPRAVALFGVGLIVWAVGFIQGVFEDTYDGADLEKLAHELVAVSPTPKAE